MATDWPTWPRATDEELRSWSVTRGDDAGRAARSHADLAAENAALREKLEAAEAERDFWRGTVATANHERDEARAGQAAAWEAAEPIRSLIELTEEGEITGLHCTDEFGIYLLGDDREPVYCAVTLTFEQLGKIGATQRSDPPAALAAHDQRVRDAVLEEAAEDHMRRVQSCRQEANEWRAQGEDDSAADCLAEAIFHHDSAARLRALKKGGET